MPYQVAAFIEDKMREGKSGTLAELIKDSEIERARVSEISDEGEKTPEELQERSDEAREIN